MSQIKIVSLLIITTLSLTACGAKNFNSNEASSARAESGDVNLPPSNQPPSDQPPTTTPNSPALLSGDQCFLIYDVWGLNNPNALNNTAYVSDADCMRTAAASVTANFGVPKAASYALYHLTPAQIQTLLTQQGATADTVNAGFFKEALVNSGIKAFTHVVGYYDDIL